MDAALRRRVRRFAHCSSCAVAVAVAVAVADHNGGSLPPALTAKSESSRSLMRKRLISEKRRNNEREGSVKATRRPG